MARNHEIGLGVLGGDVEKGEIYANQLSKQAGERLRSCLSRRSCTIYNRLDCIEPARELSVSIFFSFSEGENFATHSKLISR